LVVEVELIHVGGDWPLSVVYAVLESELLWRRLNNLEEEIRVLLLRRRV
jgi:hypothetical protein